MQQQISLSADHSAEEKTAIEQQLQRGILTGCKPVDGQTTESSHQAHIGKPRGLDFNQSSIPESSSLSSINHNNGVPLDTSNYSSTFHRRSPLHGMTSHFAHDAFDVTSSAYRARQAITGKDSNLNLQRVDSNNSIELDVVHTPQSCGGGVCIDELPCEAREAPPHSNSDCETGSVSLLSAATSLLPNSTPAGLSPKHHESTSEEEGADCNFDEIYPLHKKFRMHRKRAAAAAARKETAPSLGKSNTQTQEFDDSPEAKKICMDNNKSKKSHDNRTNKNDTHFDMDSSAEDNSVNVTISHSSENSSELSHLSDKFRDYKASPHSSSGPDSPTDSDDSLFSDDVTISSHMTSEDDVTSPDYSAAIYEQGVHTCGWLGCCAEFTNLEALVGHVNDAHVRAERDIHYKCYWNNCPRRGKGFNARYKMLIHVRTHTNERPYKCNLCHKCFSRLENLKIHNRSHTGERPYVCPFAGCGKAYSNSSDRFKHVRTHREQKPYSCRMPGCDKRYTDPSSLRKHIKTHGHYYRSASENAAPSSDPAIIAKSTANIPSVPTGLPMNTIGVTQSESPKRPTVASELVKGDEMEDRVPRAETGLSGRANPFDSVSHRLYEASRSSLLSYLPGYLSAGQYSLLSPTVSMTSALSKEQLFDLRANEEYQSKAALLKGNYFAGLSLSRHFLGLNLPGFGLPESSPFALHSNLHRASSLLLPHPSMGDSRPYIGRLGSTGSVSPVSATDSAQSGYTDSEACSSPPLAYSLQSQHSESVSPRLSPKNSAFSSVKLASPYTAHPYSRLNAENVNGGSPSIRARPDTASSASREIVAPSVSRPESTPSFNFLPSPPHRPTPTYPTLPLHCHPVPHFDLGPAFPALHLLNHA